MLIPKTSKCESLDLHRSTKAIELTHKLVKTANINSSHFTRFTKCVYQDISTSVLKKNAYYRGGSV